MILWAISVILAIITLYLIWLMSSNPDIIYYLIWIILLGAGVWSISVFFHLILEAFIS